MRRRARLMTSALVVFGLSSLAAVPVHPADPEIDNLLQSPVGKDWVANGREASIASFAQPFLCASGMI